MEKSITNSIIKYINKYYAQSEALKRLSNGSNSNTGYNKYYLATGQYIKTLEAEIMANSPSLFIGEHLEFGFKYDSYFKAKNGLYVARNKYIKIILEQEPTNKIIYISGIAQADPDKLGGIIIISQNK